MDRPSLDLKRRGFLAGLTGGLISTLGAGPRRTSSQAANPNLIRDENQKAGSPDWQLTRVRVDKDGFRSPWIEGHCSKQSVQAGESIDLLISTDPPRPFQVEVFRMGH